MNAPEIIQLLQRRLGLEGVDDSVFSPPALLDLLTKARDDTRMELSMDPRAFKLIWERVTLTEPTSPSLTWVFPANTKEPIRNLGLYEATTHRRLTPREEYLQDTITSWEMHPGVTPTGGLYGRFILMLNPLEEVTKSADIGLPEICHQHLAFAAAMVALMTNEESDAKAAAALYQDSLDRILRVLGQFDRFAGAELGAATAGTYGRAYTP